MSANFSEVASDLEIICNSEMEYDVERVSELEAKLVASNDETNFLVIQEIRKMHKQIKLMQKTTEEVMGTNKILFKMVDKLKSENEKLKEQIEMDREDGNADQWEEIRHLKNQIEEGDHIEKFLIGSVEKMRLRAEKAEEKCAELSNALEEKNKATGLETTTLFEEHTKKIEELEKLVLTLTKQNVEAASNDSLEQLNGVWKLLMTTKPEDDEEQRKTKERSLIYYTVSETKHTVTTVHEGQILFEASMKIGEEIRHAPDWTTRAYVKNGGLSLVDKYLDDLGNEVESRTEIRVVNDFLCIQYETGGIEEIKFYKRV